MLRLNEILAKKPNFFKVIAQGDDGFAVQWMHLKIIASWGMSWDHVSVTVNEDRCPTWDEMCLVKDLCWHEDETVIQYHPTKKNNVNTHPFCLHLWKPQRQGLPLPRKEMVG